MSCLITHTMLYSIIATPSRVHIPGFIILTVTMLLAGSLCLWQGYHGFGRVTIALAGSLFLWHGHYAFCMVTTWLGHYVFGMVTTPLVWSPRLWYGHHAFGMVTMSLAWSPCLQNYSFVTAHIFCIFGVFCVFSVFSNFDFESLLTPNW